MVDMLFIPLEILLVEDTGSDAALIRNWFDELGPQKYKIYHVTDIVSAQSALSKYSFRAVMLDLSLPDASGLEGLDAIHNMVPAIPIVIMTGCDDEAMALKAVEKGAQDYLIKNVVTCESLARAIHYAIQRKLFESSVIHQANFDRLTGLANRLLFESRLNMALGRVARTGQGLALLFIDLNDFKEVNDSYGHVEGDEVLKEIGKRIKKCIRPYDTAARLGGDEFVILIEGVKHQGDCASIADKLVELVSEPVITKKHEICVGISIGIEISTATDKLSPENLISHADRAMYLAKEKKGNTYCFYTEGVKEMGI